MSEIITKRDVGSLKSIFGRPGTGTILPKRKSSSLEVKKNDPLSPAKKGKTVRITKFDPTPIPVILPLQLFILFDNTGSMEDLADELKSRIQFIVEEVLTFEKRAEICVIAYKDFVDSPWVAKSSGLSRSASFLAEFLQKFPSYNGDGGSNAGEAMEYAFHLVNKEVGNGSGNIVLIVAGDQVPNGYVNDETFGYNYKDELQSLKRKNAVIHMVGVSGRGWDSDDEDFFRITAKQHNGQYFELSDMNDLTKIILSMAAKSTGRPDLADFYRGGGSLKKLPMSQKKALCAPKPKQLK